MHIGPNSYRKMNMSSLVDHIRERYYHHFILLVQPTPNMYPQIILFGDSVTQCMTTNIQAWLQTRYSRRADIINRGFGGYTSQQGLSLLPKIIPSLHPDTSPEIKLCFVFFGANDAFQPPQTPGRPRVHLEDFLSNISKIVEYLLSISKEMKVVLIGV